MQATLPNSCDDRAGIRAALALATAWTADSAWLADAAPAVIATRPPPVRSTTRAPVPEDGGPEEGSLPDQNMNRSANWNCRFSPARVPKIRPKLPEPWVAFGVLN